jgi:purine-binding chemotaxis protein CheW
LAKPITRQSLLNAVESMLSAATARRRSQMLAILPLRVGNFEFVLDLSLIETVLSQCAMLHIPAAPPHLVGFFELRGEHVPVVDMAERLGVEHTESILERKLVVVSESPFKVALCVDDVRDPEEVPRVNVTELPAEGAEGDRSLVPALVQSPRGPVPLLRPQGVLSRGLRRRLPRLLAQAMERAAAVES